MDPIVMDLSQIAEGIARSSGCTPHMAIIKLKSMVSMTMYSFLRENEAAIEKIIREKINDNDDGYRGGHYEGGYKSLKIELKRE